MTRRGRLALALGATTYLAAWAFGSKILYPVGIGLPVAVLLAWLWTALANRPLSIRRTLPSGERLEGEDVEVVVRLASERRLLPARWTLRERIGKLGELTTPVGATGYARYVLERLPRGRYEFERSVAVIEDPFGLERVEQPLESPGALLVYPRLVELGRLFSESGTRSHDGRRLLLRRPSGFDLHSVRDYEHGDSLRKVHWRSTARRGQLMVKELEDTSHDGAVVLLDCDPAGDVGVSPASSFDTVVRIAGSILQAHAVRGRVATLVSTGRGCVPIQVRSAHAELGGAVLALAAAEPDAPCGLARALAGIPATGGELTVVTSTLDPAAFAAVLSVAARRAVSVVWVDSASFAARPTRAEPGLLRLAAHGVPAAVVRDGDDLASVLSARRIGVAAHG